MVGDDRAPSTDDATRTGMAGDPMTAEAHGFAQRALQSGETEVQLAQLAQQRASDARVREFAQQLERDHRQATQELQRMSQHMTADRPLTPDQPMTAERPPMTPTEQPGMVGQPGMPGADAQQVMSRLEGLSGAEFDRAYLEEVVNHHQRDISEFERAPQQYQLSGELRQFVDRTLPTLRQHLQQAEQLLQSLGER